ncbi:MAG: ComF family protein [Gammaproteobacteria bacterium AqS3]|nr:ComF family protein [Gammaproteobacteria bacterium AqS3]
MLLRTLWRRFIPHRCTLCRNIFEGTGALCGDCRSDLTDCSDSCRCCLADLASSALDRCGPCLVRPRFFRASAAVRYRGAAQALIREFKFRNRPRLAHTLALLMVESRLRQGGYLPQLLIPTPLHPSRLAERGYNQAALLGQQCARILGVDCDPFALERRGAKTPVAQLSRRERQAAVRGAMTCRRKLNASTRIALIDDVMTSGATCSEAERALRRAGARDVEIWVFAHRALGDGDLGAEERT